MALQATFKNTTFHVGDNIEVFHKIREADKTRTQAFGGIVISIKGHQDNKSFTVRRIAAGAIGVERIWPLNSPWISKVKIVKRGKVRRAKLYYLRKRRGKGAIRVKASDRIKIKEKVDEKEKSGEVGREPGSKISSKR